MIRIPRAVRLRGKQAVYPHSPGGTVTRKSGGTVPAFRGRYGYPEVRHNGPQYL